MGNSPALLDLICGFRTGRRLSDQLGAGLAALDGIGAVIWYSVLQVLPAEDGANGCCRPSVAGASEIGRPTEAVLGDGDRGVMVMSRRARLMG